MPNTPNYSLPYPLATDPADVPADMQELAVAVDGALDVVDDRVDLLEPKVSALEAADIALDTRLDTLEPTVPLARITPGTVTGQVLTNAAGNIPTWATGGGGGGAMVAIQDILLGANGQIDFTGIPATYRHLEIVLCVASVAGGSIMLAVNGDDAAANYSSQLMGGTGTSAGAAAGNPYLGSQNVATGAIPTIGRVLIPNYAATGLNKAWIFTTGGPSRAEIVAAWHSTLTAPLTRIRVAHIGAPTNLWKTGSRATLYGIT